MPAKANGSRRFAATGRSWKEWAGISTAALHVAEGLVQHYIATGDPKDLELLKESIGAAMKAYDDPAYADAYTTQFTAVEIPKGMRVQGNTMVLVGRSRSC